MTTDNAAALGAPLIFVLELAVLYTAGTYTTGRMAGLLGFRGGCAGILGRVIFYLLILPGVVLHETAHYLACLLTGTKVLSFVPFSPQRSAGGRLMLGYVQHERRSFPVRAIIGLAPILLNPLGILLVTAVLTPLSLAEAANPRFEVIRESILANSFLTDRPLVVAFWAYLSLSFALGSVPSREDLASLPVALLCFGAGVLLASFLQVSSEDGITAALYDLCTVGARIYSLPAIVATVAAVVIGLWERMPRY